MFDANFTSIHHFDSACVTISTLAGLAVLPLSSFTQNTLKGTVTCESLFELMGEKDGFGCHPNTGLLLNLGGFATIQIKYSTSEARTKSRMWGYKYDVANMTAFPIHTFWELSKAAGFEPLAQTLQPRQELVGDERYAYFFPSSSMNLGQTQRIRKNRLELSIFMKIMVAACI